MTEAARKESAVLIPVFRDAAGELRLVLVIRQKQGIHGGQLGLPGGRIEAGDRSPLEAALRETEEEIGLGRDTVEVLAQLPTVNSRTTGFRLHPFLARIRQPARWRTSPGEITGVVTPQVSTLADRAAREERSLSFPTWSEERRVECVPVEGGHMLWGLTLRVIDPLLPYLLADASPT